MKTAGQTQARFFVLKFKPLRPLWEHEAKIMNGNTCKKPRSRMEIPATRNSRLQMEIFAGHFWESIQDQGYIYRFIRGNKSQINEIDPLKMFLESKKSWSVKKTPKMWLGAKPQINDGKPPRGKRPREKTCRWFKEQFDKMVLIDPPLIWKQYQRKGSLETA